MVANLHAPLRVLVVDDEPLIRWAIDDVLGSAGYDVVDASTAATALRLVQQAGQGFDVILLDYCLPDSTDLRTLQTIHTLSPTSRLVFMSASGTPELFDRARQLGACCVLPKPFDLFRLPTTLRTLASSGVARTGAPVSGRPARASRSN